jgi:hypothetical protein
MRKVMEPLGQISLESPPLPPSPGAPAWALVPPLPPALDVPPVLEAPPEAPPLLDAAPALAVAWPPLPVGPVAVLPLLEPA